MLRLVQELGGLGPKERMTVKAMKALLHRFDEPLTDNDIVVIAKLTRLDKDSLLVASSQGLKEQPLRPLCSHVSTTKY